MKDSRITRRAWATVLGSAAVLRGQPQPAPVPDLDRARQRYQGQSQALRKISLPRDVEPAFKFQA